MTDTTTAPEGVTPEAVAAKARSTAEKGASSYGSDWLPAHVCKLLMEAADRLEALAADRDAQKARADAAERRFANSERMLTQAETKLTAAEAKVARLVEAATVLHRSMELFFEADEAADEAERDGQQKEAARLRNMAHGRWQGIPGNLDALAAIIAEVQG